MGALTAIHVSQRLWVITDGRASPSTTPARRTRGAHEWISIRAASCSRSRPVPRLCAGTSATPVDRPTEAPPGLDNAGAHRRQRDIPPAGVRRHTPSREQHSDRRDDPGVGQALTPGRAAAASHGSRQGVPVTFHVNPGTVDALVAPPKASSACPTLACLRQGRAGSGGRIEAKRDRPASACASTPDADSPLRIRPAVDEHVNGNVDVLITRHNAYRLSTDERRPPAWLRRASGVGAAATPLRRPATCATCGTPRAPFRTHRPRNHSHDDGRRLQHALPTRRHRPRGSAQPGEHVPGSLQLFRCRSPLDGQKYALGTQEWETPARKGGQRRHCACRGNVELTPRRRNTLCSLPQHLHVLQTELGHERLQPRDSPQQGLDQGD